MFGIQLLLRMKSSNPDDFMSSVLPTHKCSQASPPARPLQGYGTLGEEMEHLWQNFQPVYSFWMSVSERQEAGNSGDYLAFIKYILFQRIPKHVIKLNGIFKSKFLDKNKICWGGNKSDEENLLTHSSKYVQAAVGLFLSLLIKIFATLILQFPSEDF